MKSGTEPMEAELRVAIRQINTVAEEMSNTPIDDPAEA